MNLPVAILFLVLLGLVVAVISAPLRSRAGASPEDQVAMGLTPQQHGPAQQAQEIARGELEAAREAKYREIRDSELDFRTGKLSPEDFATIDAQLRAEAIAILDRIEALDKDVEPSAPPASGSVPSKTRDA